MVVWRRQPPTSSSYRTWRPPLSADRYGAHLVAINVFQSSVVSSELGHRSCRLMVDPLFKPGFDCESLNYEFGLGAQKFEHNICITHAIKTIVTIIVFNLPSKTQNVMCLLCNPSPTCILLHNLMQNMMSISWVIWPYFHKLKASEMQCVWVIGLVVFRSYKCTKGSVTHSQHAKMDVRKVLCW